MAKEIYIGVDGGASKCLVRVENAEGELLGQAITGPGNIRISVAQSWQSILTGIEQVLNPLDIDLYDKNIRFHVGMGLAGCEVVADREAFLATPHPFTTLKLVSDAHIACLGAHSSEDGAIIVIGTGVVGYQILDKKSRKVSGWGFPHSDEGGGAWLGMEVTRMTLKWLDNRGTASPLLQAVYAHFNNDISRLVAWANHANSSEFAQLAPLITQHEKEGDPSAIFLLVKAAAAIDEVGAALDPELPCALVGGLANNLEPYLSTDLRGRLVPSQAEPVEGAILMVSEMANLDI